MLLQVKGVTLTVQSNPPTRSDASGGTVASPSVTFQREPQRTFDWRQAVVVPLFVSFLLFLPVLYVGSYMGLLKRYQLSPTSRLEAWYVTDGFVGSMARRCYWPLEQLHRWLRPGDWEPLLTEAGSFGDRRLQP